MNKKDLESALTSIYSKFEESKTIIGAKNVVFRPGEDKDSQAIKKFKRGEDVTATELLELKETWIATTPLLDSDGNPFVLYIPDFSSYETYGSLPKYHLSWCVTLERMQRAGRNDRYRPKRDIENNLFRGKNYKDEESEQELLLCKNCIRKVLKEHKIRDFEFKNPIDIIDFFAKFGKTDLPTNSINASMYSVKYPMNWSKISKRYREYIEWKCEGVNCKSPDCSRSKSFLDVHHINGVKSDVRSRNLKALCKKCHSKEPGHGHYKNMLEQQGVL